MTQREAELDAAQRRLARSETLAKEGASAVQELDDDRARMRSAQAALKATQAQAAAAKAAIEAAKAQVTGSVSAVTAAAATVQRIDAELDDSIADRPARRAGAVPPGPARRGARGPAASVLNLVDLSDVYMGFFLPETVAGRVALGSRGAHRARRRAAVGDPRQGQSSWPAPPSSRPRPWRPPASARS